MLWTWHSYLLVSAKLTAALSRTLSVVFTDSAQLQGGGGGVAAGNGA